MPKKNMRGQFTTEVYKTKKKAFALGKKSSEVPIGQLVKEAEDVLREEGRQEIIEKYKAEFVCIKKEHYDEIIDEANKDGYNKGFAIGNKMTGDARFQQGVEEGTRREFPKAYAIGFKRASHIVGSEAFAFGMCIGYVVLALGAVTGYFIGGMVALLVQ